LQVTDYSVLDIVLRLAFWTFHTRFFGKYNKSILNYQIQKLIYEVAA
jgi:hypothetical protein